MGLRKSRSELAVHRLGIGPLDDERIVAVAPQESHEVFLRGASEDRWPGDLRFVQVEDRKHRTVAGGVQKACALPRALEGPGLGFAVPHHARDEKIGMVVGGAERVRERVPELAPS